MSGLDLFLAVLLGIGAYRGFKTGAVLQIAGIAGWVIGFFVATAVMEPVGAVAADSIGVSQRAAPMLGFVLALVAVIGAFTVAAHIVRKSLKAVKLGSLDTLGGGAVGALRSAFGLSVMLLVTGFAPTPGGQPLLVSEETRESSVLYDPVEALAPVVWDVAREVTPGMQAAISDRLNTWNEGEPVSEGGEVPFE